MVFRADPKKFKKLKAEIDDFAKQPLMLSMINNTTALPQDACKICDWEVQAKCMLISIVFSNFIIYLHCWLFLGSRKQQLRLLND